MTDVQVLNEGSVIGLLPQSPAAQDWIDSNLETEGWQWLGPTLWVDHRMAGNIIDGMINDGLEVEEGEG